MIKMTCKKAKYRSEASAMIDINKIASIEQKDRKKPISAYECLKCGHWHLSSKPKKQEIFVLKNKIEELKNQVENLKEKLNTSEKKITKEKILHLEKKNKKLGKLLSESQLRINELKLKLENYEEKFKYQ